MLNNFSMSVYNSLRRAHFKLDQHIEDAPLFMFGIFSFFNYILFFVVWQFISPQIAVNLPMRIAAAVLALGLIFKDYWPKKLRPLLAYYWYGTILFSLPFFCTYMFIDNRGSDAWQLNTLLALFLLTLALDWISFIIILPLGMILGYLAHVYVYGITPVIISEPFTYYSSVIWAIIIAAVFSRKREKVQEAKYLAVKSVGASIAHELRTSMATIRAGVNGIKKFLPTLIDSYQKNQALDPQTAPIQARHIKALETVLDDMEVEVLNTNTIINMSLVKSGGYKIEPSEFEYISITTCVDEALRRYPFKTEKQASLVQWDPKNEFLFKGSRFLTVHILYNLIKNALYYIAAARKGDIKIWLACGDTYNELHFKDTGQGIPKDILPNIFASFYSKTHNGTGIGLAFCKMVMQSFGGDITCESSHSMYTHFTLVFPQELEKQ